MTLHAALKAGDVLIDFTFPEASLEHIKTCAELGKPIVIGSTGFSKEQLDVVNKYVQKIPCVLSPNMSIGVNVCFKILADLAKTLGDDFDMEIVEAHHRMKKDAPSGTAVRMGEVMAEAVTANLDEVGVYARKGMTGSGPKRRSACRRSAAGTSSASNGLFVGKGERIEITHRAHTP